MAKAAKAAKAKEQSLESVYQELEKVLKGYAPPFEARDGGVRGKSSLFVTIVKPIAVPGEYGGKPTKRMMAAAILQKGYVGFYLMCSSEVKKKLSPALVKLLKGKACFHVKELDAELKKDMVAALDVVAKIYKERGWV